MPAGLLDTMTRDEILDLLAWIIAPGIPLIRHFVRSRPINWTTTKYVRCPIRIDQRLSKEVLRTRLILSNSSHLTPSFPEFVIHGD